MNKAELSEVCVRVLRSKDGDARVVALALQRFLLHEGRRVRFDKKAYMREYMRQRRADEKARGLIRKFRRERMGKRR